MTVEVERLVDTAFEGVVHDEVEPAEAGKLVAFDVTGQQGAETLLEEVAGQLPRNGAVMPVVVHEHADVRAVAFVSRAGVGDVTKQHGAAHATSISVRVFTWSRASDAE